MEKENETPAAVPTPPAAEPTPAPVTPPAVPAASSMSSTGSTSSLNGPMPQELQGWNWGAFLLTWIWGIGHSVWISLLVLLGFIPFVGPIIVLVMAILLGVKGNEWAWQHRKFESVEQFKAVQKAWAMWGLIVFIVGVVISIFAFSALVAFLFHTGTTSM